MQHPVWRKRRASARGISGDDPSVGPQPFYPLRQDGIVGPREATLTAGQCLARLQARGQDIGITERAAQGRRTRDMRDIENDETARIGGPDRRQVDQLRIERDRDDRVDILADRVRHIRGEPILRAVAQHRLRSNAEHSGDAPYPGQRGQQHPASRSDAERLERKYERRGAVVQRHRVRALEPAGERGLCYSNAAWPPAGRSRDRPALRKQCRADLRQRPVIDFRPDMLRQMEIPTMSRRGKNVTG